MKALRLHAGPVARRHIEAHGLRAQDVRVVPGAAGGPKGLILGPIDRFLFGDWLLQSEQAIDLVGASIGAWRLANACLDAPLRALHDFEQGYIAQHFELPPGQKRLSAQQVSAQFRAGLRTFYGGRAPEVLQHPRFRLQVITAHGLHVLGREGRVRTALGYLGAFAANGLRRKSLGGWLERVVFSSHGGALPFGTDDFPTRRVALSEANFEAALQASCSIPFMLEAVHDIPGAPPGAYWDGGITDYHLHLDYRPAEEGLVLYPHFQRAVVPGWLDKGLKWRHKPTPFLDRTVLLAPAPEWVATLPGGKLPDRNDFLRYGNDLAGRMSAWRTAASEAQRLADELEQWLLRPDMTQVRPL
jgi:hypothetical protein